MRINEMFSSNYLKAADLGGQPVKVCIDDTRLEDIDGESKPVLRFRGRSKGLVLNRINSQVLADSLGDETDAWRGKEIELHRDKTHYQGRLVDCLRVRIPAPPPPPPPAADDADDVGSW